MFGTHAAGRCLSGRTMVNIGGTMRYGCLAQSRNCCLWKNHKITTSTHVALEMLCRICDVVLQNVRWSKIHVEHPLPTITPPPPPTDYLVPAHIENPFPGLPHFSPSPGLMNVRRYINKNDPLFDFAHNRSSTKPQLTFS